MKIVRKGDKYLIKRWLFGWEYLDSDGGGGWWNCRSSVNKYCLFNTLEDAIKTLNSTKEEVVSKEEIQNARINILHS